MKNCESHKTRSAGHAEKAGATAQDGIRMSQSEEQVRIEYCFWPYGWLRLPSILLVGVGILGILCRRVEPMGQALRFWNMPPEFACYGIVLGACILFGISLICRHRQTDILAAAPTATNGREHWRSI